MRTRAIFATVLGLAVIFPFVGVAYAVPGLIKALTELHQAYSTFSTVSKAVDDAEKKIRPSTDFSGAAKAYQSAATDLNAIQFPPWPTPPSAAPAVPVTSCAARASTISSCSSTIAGIQASLASIQAEMSQLNDGMRDVQLTTGAVVVIEKAMPAIASVPIWGNSTAAELLSMTKNVREADGNTLTPISKRMKQDVAALQALSASLVTWTRALDQATQFKSAPAPQGSYAQSCNACAYDCEQLICNCRRINGSFIRTSINYPSCRSVENADGNLRCGP